ncbi:rhodanese-like domain-containing protein [Herbaspirillum sp. HC18]|nr:rhodanese-like domain-containing protein [Herbaspirillum sp. HC18]
MQARRIILKTIIALGLASCGALASAADFKDIDVQQGQALAKQGALLLDVREPDEYAAGHAPGSTLLPLGQIKDRANEIRTYRDKPVVVMCRSGKRSAQAAGILTQLGFTSVYNVQGGILAWEKAGLPVEKK